MPAIFSPWAVPVFWAVGLAWLAFYLNTNPGRAMADAKRRYEILADTRHRLEANGQALAESIQAAGLFHKATPDQLRLEEDGEEMFLYLSEAEHHDNHLFAGAPAELMSPVENPRYLLRLDLPGDWTKGEYFVSVPSALGNKKMTTDLTSRLGQSVEQYFEPVYTREPAGRLHLLTARLQATSKGEAAEAERDMLWRQIDGVWFVFSDQFSSPQQSMKKFLVVLISLTFTFLGFGFLKWLTVLQETRRRCEEI